MIAGLRPYPQTRDSGVAWLGAVPDHWDVLPNRALFQEREVSNLASEPMLSVTIRRGVVPQAEQLSDTGKRDGSNLDRSKYKLVEPGDLAYNKMRAWQGAIGASAYRGIVSPAYIVQRPRDGQNSLYFHHLFRTSGFTTEVERWSYGITSDQWSLRPQHFKMIYCPSPPADEQAAIVRFLDHADRRIRRSIAAKQKMTRLLEEQKAAVIHRAVTRGLNPDAPTKASGLAWSTEVPHDWDVVPLRRRCAVVDCKHVTVPFFDFGIPLASVRECRNFDLRFDHARRTSPEFAELLMQGGRKPAKGDLIYCRNVAAGACTYVDTPDDFAMGQDVCLIRPQRESGRFLNYVMHSPLMEVQLEGLMIGSTFRRVNVEEIKGLLLQFPPRSEQDAIVAYLDERLHRITQTSETALHEIALLLEYRARLIADVVTGKLDVRAASAALPAFESERVDALEDIIEIDQDADLEEAKAEEEFA